MTALDELLKMYPWKKYVYATSDGVYHLTLSGASAQSVHLASHSIDRITCKTRKITSLSS
jgi:hypothetical protein